jgi:hypothetical protein
MAYIPLALHTTVVQMYIEFLDHVKGMFLFCIPAAGVCFETECCSAV